MRRAKLFFDPSAQRKQFGLPPRCGNDLDAGRLFVRAPWRRQGEDRETDQRDNEGNGEIIDRRFHVLAVDLHHLARAVLPRKDRGSRRHQKIGARQQIAKASVDGRATAFGGQIILRREPPARLDIPDHRRRQFSSACFQQRAVAVGDMRGAQRPERLDGAAAIRRGLLDICDPGQRFAGGSEPGSNGAGDRRNAEIGCDGEPHPPDARRIAGCVPGRQGITAVAPGTGRQHPFEIVNRAAEKTVRGEHVPAQSACGNRNAARRRTDRYDVAKAGWRAHRTAEVGAVRQRRHSGRHGNGGAARRAAGSERRIEGIARRSAEAICAYGTEAEFRSVGLANDNRPGLPKPRDHQFVLVRDMVLEQRRSIGCSQSPRIGQILHGDGHAMQRADRPACRIASVGLKACTFGIDSQERRKFAVVRGDPGEMRFERITCGNLTPSQGVGKRSCGQLAGVFANHHGARLHELPGNDDNIGTRLAYSSRLGGVLYG